MGFCKQQVILSTGGAERGSSVVISRGKRMLRMIRIAHISVVGGQCMLVSH